MANRFVPASNSTSGASRFADPGNGGMNRLQYLQRDRTKQLAPPSGISLRSPTIPLSVIFPVLVLLLISMTFGSGGEGRGIDKQSAIRLAGYGLAAVSVLFALGLRQLTLNWSMLSWLLVPIFIIGTALYALEPTFALAAGLAHLALLLFAWRLVARLGQLRTVLAIVIAGLIIGALSVYAYFFWPDIGQASVALAGSDVGIRMRGVTAQPNSLGVISALTILLAVMHFRAFTTRQRVLVGVAILIASLCLVYSDSRTNIAALALCLLLWVICRANAAINLFAVAGIALAACLVTVFVPNVGAYLSRSGSSEEIASLNGRSRIWDVAWEHIYAHPFLGQGYGASRLLLPQDDRLFDAALNTHNLYLELLVSGGITLLALFVLAVAIALIRSARARRIDAMIALLFFLMIGVAESTSFSGLPLFGAFVLYTAVALGTASRESQQARSVRRHFAPPAFSYPTESVR